MYYADRLMEFPSGVLGVALGTILLPSLSKSFASGNHDEYNRLMDWGCVFVSVGAAECGCVGHSFRSVDRFAVSVR